MVGVREDGDGERELGIGVLRLVDPRGLDSLDHVADLREAHVERHAEQVPVMWKAAQDEPSA